MPSRSVHDYQPCKVPLRRVSFGDASLVVHEGIMAAIQRIEAGWKARGGNSAYRVRKADTGAYNCRKTTSGRSWSKHSYGCAVDINWQTNPYGRHLKTDMPSWFVALWKAEGFGWGGDWRTVKDAMHFSKFPNEGGDGKLYVGEPTTTQPEEPKPVAPTLEQKVDAIYEALMEKRPDEEGNKNLYEHLDILERRINRLLDHFQIPYTPTG